MSVRAWRWQVAGLLLVACSSTTKNETAGTGGSAGSGGGAGAPSGGAPGDGGAASGGAPGSGGTASDGGPGVDGGGGAGGSSGCAQADCNPRTECCVSAVASLLELQNAINAAGQCQPTSLCFGDCNIFCSSLNIEYGIKCTTCLGIKGITMPCNNNPTCTSLKACLGTDCSPK